ncbi:hypothetical protein DL89DRAFT_265262 [Linderina pennispora]|uniref:RING-type domain-containing protein n=1 Tax=Linderina pennispora TaxID=61395 RepID=A0A1Y1WJ44_9FUNG|nr:uncharacterized protein DL89DRAFT_265262 [Linderina pennispora]ORX73124.1 hypothetical protein DL89DRAFT_265262 [Linderina pennispora]
MTASTATSSLCIKHTLANFVVRAFMGGRPASTLHTVHSTPCSSSARSACTSPQPSALQVCTGALYDVAAIAARSVTVLALLASAVLSKPPPRANPGTRQVMPISSTRGSRRLPTVADLDQRLPVLSLAKSSNPKHREMCLEKCPICLDCVGECTKVRVLPCKHYYHAECIDSWATTQSTRCPMCKADCMEF